MRLLAILKKYKRFWNIRTEFDVWHFLPAVIISLVSVRFTTNVLSYTNTRKRMAGLRSPQLNSKISSMQSFGQNDESLPLADDISEYGNGRKIRYRLSRKTANESLLGMFMFCRIGMYCIVISMMMPSSLQQLQWKEIQ